MAFWQNLVDWNSTGCNTDQGIVENITAKKKAKEALKVSEEKYFKAFNNVPAWVIISSLESGRILTMLFSAEVLELANETCMVSVSQDITTRIEAANQLKESHERFLTVLESLDATIYVADMETYEILYMNKKMKQLFNAELTGCKCYEALRGETEA